MNVLVYGAGAVGSFVGAVLARAGERVTLLGRPAHVQAVVRGGLQVEGPGGSRTWVRIPAASRPEELDGPFDAVLVTVKGYDTHGAASTIPHLLAPYGRVVCLQNGVGHEEVLAGQVGSGRVVAGAVTTSVSLAAPGRVVQHTRGGVVLASWDGAPVEDVVDGLRRGGLAARAAPDARGLKWSKLLLNLVANATCAVLDLPPGLVYGHPGLFRVERRMLQEAVAVGRALGVRWLDLPGFPVRMLVPALRWPEPVARGVLRRAVSGGRGTKMPSLWHDLARSRTEVAYLNGAVARWGAAVGVATPVNEALARLVEELSLGLRDRELFRHHPEALMQALAR